MFDIKMFKIGLTRKMNAQLIQKYFISEYSGHRYMSLMSVFKLLDETLDKEMEKE